MKRSFILIGLFCISLSNTYAQQSVVGTIPSNPVQIQTATRGIVTELPMAPPETNGDVYLNSDWTLAEIALAEESTVLKNYSVKLNLQTNALEILYQNQVRLLPDTRVSHFFLIQNDGRKEKYVSGNSYLLNDQPMGGFLQVIDSGKWMLLVKKELRVVEATYNPALHVGKRNNEYVKDERSFLSKENRLFELDLPVKKFCRQFNGFEEAVGQFIKEEKINLRKREDALMLLDYLNEHI